MFALIFVFLFPTVCSSLTRDMTAADILLQVFGWRGDPVIGTSDGTVHRLELSAAMPSSFLIQNDDIIENSHLCLNDLPRDVLEEQLRVDLDEPNLDFWAITKNTQKQPSEHPGCPGSIIVDVRIPASNSVDFNVYCGRFQLLSHQILIEDVTETVKEQMPSKHAGFFEKYQRLHDIYVFMEELVWRRPYLASLITIGTTHEGREIKGLVISTTPKNSTIVSKPQIVYNGGQHAREWIGVAVQCYFMQRLTIGYERIEDEEQIHALLDKFDITVIPVLNPDGYEYTHTKDRMWYLNTLKNTSNNI